MVIKQPAQKLPPVAVETLLKPGVIKTSGVGPVQEANQRLELLTTRSEPIHRLAERAAGVAVLFDCTITTTAHERQDFTHRRVKFNSTGVEIGGHVRPPPWSTKDLNNADFDTLFMTPRPRPAAPTTPPPNPAEHLKTPARASPEAINRPQAPLHRPGAAPDLTANVRNLPDLQGIPRQSRPSSGHFRKAAPVADCVTQSWLAFAPDLDAALSATSTSSTGSPGGWRKSGSAGGRPAGGQVE